MLKGGRDVRLVFDFDFVKFAAASLGEKRSIRAIHKQSGNEKEFDTRTDFWGDWRKKEGGYLAEINKGRTTPFVADDFEIIDVQTPMPKSHPLKVANAQIESICARLGTTDYYGYVGKGKSFREDLSTILKYKGNREGVLRPLYLDDVAEHLIKKHNAQWQEHYEVDDRVVMDWYKDNSLVCCVAEKDFMGCEIDVFNPDTMTTPTKIRGLGGLYINGKKEVKGQGRKWKYHQCLSLDLADNYKANSASDKRWGEKSSFQLLDPCRTDKECFEAMVKGYKTLYPEPKVIKGWRGNDIEIDWLYVMNENLNLCHMHRWENDFLDTKAILTKLNVPH